MGYKFRFAILTALLFAQTAIAAPDTTIKIGFVRTPGFNAVLADQLRAGGIPVLQNVWGMAGHPRGIALAFDSIRNLPSGIGYDYQSIHTATARARIDPTIKAWRDLYALDLIVLYANVNTSGVTACGGVSSTGSSFIAGSFIPLPSTYHLDVKNADTDFVIVMSSKCNPDATTARTLAHEVTHIFGGTHLLGNGGLTDRARAAYVWPVATIGVSPAEDGISPVSIIPRWSAREHYLLGDSSHDNLGAVTIVAASVAAFRPKLAPVETAPPVPANFGAWKTRCINTYTQYIGGWDGHSSASRYEMFWGYGQQFVLSTPNTFAYFYVLNLSTYVQVRACNSAGCSGLTPPAYVSDTCDNNPF